MITNGIHVNMLEDDSASTGTAASSTTAACTTSPSSRGRRSSTASSKVSSSATTKFPELNQAIDEVAARYACRTTTIAIAWLLRHPAKMQPVTGTMNLDRLTQCAAAGDVHITREEWYQIYLRRRQHPALIPLWSAFIPPSR